jgi:hypothetical protein
VERNAAVYVCFNVHADSALLAFSDKDEDIEVAVSREDAWKIGQILAQALALAPALVDKPGLLHGFTNLDGGEDASFQVQALGNAIEMTIHRSDEGDQTICISKSDADELTETLIRALEVPPATPEQEN